ncbi:UDP-N-acetylmuramate dehydrogenase [Tomitella fengzijianii]|uniref:UDP-N-acetylenolpyruvoylglucosamine reductase n=1 Tax=Tomitella fengzijianii TaxID=2597660 RepID=A0A516X5A4_9ACTN|nr:UDP-N-acetylmuramate dehydrogenase [Tomitella fengzijianii]QDQ98268.1 UDP-N-acetylmuramate dehydrogenase [Tomitella fengzijianii]
MHTLDLPGLAADAGAGHAADAPLSGLTTLRLGGPCTHLLTCADTRSLVAVVRALDAAGESTLILGGGSNLVIADSGFDGAAVRVASAGIDVDGTLVRADAGALWDDVVAATVAAGLGGLECLSGIPGSAGATPVQNVGAYGAEIADVLERVELLDRRTGERHWVAPDALRLGYRTSVLKHRDDALVLTVEMRLHDDGLSAPLRYGELASAMGAEPGARAPSADVRRAVLRLRTGKGMVADLMRDDGTPDHDSWSAGSFFTNPVIDDADLPGVLEAVAARVGDGARVPQYAAGGGRTKLSAGWLIERSGYGKGYPGEGAPTRLSTKHTLALTNRGAARTGDLLALAREVRDGVRAAFGVRLEPEPVLVGCEI